MKKSIIFLILIFLCGCCVNSNRTRREKSFSIDELVKKMPPPPENKNFAYDEKTIVESEISYEKDKKTSKKTEDSIKNNSSYLAKKETTTSIRKIPETIPEITSEKIDLSSLFSLWKGECLI